MASSKAVIALNHVRVYFGVGAVGPGYSQSLDMLFDLIYYCIIY